MQTKTVLFTDYDDQPKSEKLYFNLTKTELMDFMGSGNNLEARIENWSKSITPDKDELTTDQVKELLEIMKVLIEASYGERSEDGKHFRKSPEIFANFKDTAAYDALIFGLFLNPDDASEFMVSILPKDLAADARAQMEKVAPETVAELPEGEMSATEMEVPAYIREDRDPTMTELRAMTREEQLAAFARKTQS